MIADGVIGVVPPGTVFLNYLQSAEEATYENRLDILCNCDGCFNLRSAKNRPLKLEDLDAPMLKILKPKEDIRSGTFLP